MTSTDYNLGFQDAEETETVRLSWEGISPPEWLRGTLFRNGPGRFSRGEESVSHWFDGLALLHALTIDSGGVTYRSRFLRSHEYRRAKQTGRIDAPGFACDPCRSLFRKVASAFVLDATDNANINVVKQGEDFLALTELPVATEFDPKTLRTVGPWLRDDQLPDGSTTAHPHQSEGDLYNFLLHYSATPTFRCYRQRDRGPREEFARIPVKNVPYVHSFGLSRRWMILACGPFQVAPLTLLVRNRPFIENFHWAPAEGASFHFFPRDGRSQDPVTLVTNRPFFAFHHINSFDLGENESLVDLVGYENADVIEQLRLARLARGEGIDFGYFQRYRCDVLGRRAEKIRQSRHPLELPRISYRRCNTQPYRYVYGISAHPQESLFYDRLIKLDVESDLAQFWYEPNCFPGEPVFVADPAGLQEDEGLLLSLVLTGSENEGEGSSFLLVLNARTLEEVARTNLPSVVPHGFHGFFDRE